jgi:hypothetical protein
MARTVCTRSIANDDLLLIKIGYPVEHTTYLDENHKSSNPGLLLARSFSILPSFKRFTASTKTKMPIARTMGRCAFLLLLLAKGHDAQSSYSNVTLKANGGDLSVVIYLPQGIKPDEPTYYVSSRFDQGSMIGSIQRTITSEEDGTKETHELYGRKQWRAPHDPFWPESGVGLASEFGVGDDGAFCTFFCGWYGVNEVTNGVLGYEDAKNGEPFLKIGVGELIKGSCTTCDSTDDFKFNSPYQFAKTPVWTLKETPETNSIVLEHQAVLNENGYDLRKEITLNDDELLVKNTLTNTGRTPFATAWYSHHFFTCDSEPVGKGYGVDLDVTGTGGTFQEPGTWSWSTPLRTYAEVKASKEKVSVEMQRGVERDVRIKAEFDQDETSHGGFRLRGCGTTITETIPEVGTDGGVSMYAFNLYIESGTFSPEPQIYLHLWPGESSSWTQRLVFSDTKPEPPKKHWGWFLGLETIASPTASGRHPTFSFMLFVLSATCLTLSIHWGWRRRRERNHYSSIPDQ